MQHNKCNLQAKQNKFVPFYFHNLSGYDGHLFFNELMKHNPDKEVKLLANAEEKYISFDFGCIRFLDSYRFMAFQLDYLANLLKQDQLKFVNKQNNVNKVLSLETEKLKNRKGIQ